MDAGCCAVIVKSLGSELSCVVHPERLDLRLGVMGSNFDYHRQELGEGEVPSAE